MRGTCERYAVRNGFKERLSKVHALVIGCGRVGSSVAQRLADDGWSVAVIDEAVEAFNRLSEDFPGETFQGHALDLEVIEAAGVERAEACVVATNGDNTNLLTAQMLQRKYSLRCVVVRILDPARAQFYASRGLNVICPTAGAIDDLTAAVAACRTEVV